MPTVPPTCTSLDPFHGPLSHPFTSDGPIAGPTPDPDTDDVLLVSLNDGNAVSQECSNQIPPFSSMKPFVELGNLTFHSPSSIVGTPFDPSPRFEYPFPNPTCSHSLAQDVAVVAPSLAILGSHLPPLPSLPSGFPALPFAVSLPSIPPVIGPKARGEGRSFSPTHLKLNPRDPPIPPGLAKKRRLNHNHNPADSTAPTSNPSQGRARSGSFSSLSDMLPDEVIRGWGAEKDRSRPLDVRWKRNSLALNESNCSVVQSKSDVKISVGPLLSHDNSSYPSLPSEPTRHTEEYLPPLAPPCSTPQ